MSKFITLFQPGELTTWQDTAYSGASVQRKELADWTPVAEPPDAELLPELETIVARSRDLGRNHGIASSGFQTQIDNIIGSNGLRLAAMPDFRALGKDITWAQEWSRNVESHWRAYADTFYFDAARRLNFNGCTAMVLRTVLMSGECLALPLWIEDRAALYGTTFQLIEGDRLSNPNYAPDTNSMRGGIEMDDYGKPLAYHLRKVSADDWMVPGFWTIAARWERIPATTKWGRKRVLHVFEPDRIGQTRGKPLLTSVLEQFKMFDHYQRTELQSSIVNALVAGVIETPLDQSQIASMMGDDPNGYLAQKLEWKTRLKGGAMIPLYPGDKLTPFTPARPATQYGNFVETVLRHIATAQNIPYELLVKDFSKTNYSSARASLLEAWRYFLSRRQWLSMYWARPVYELWIEEAVSKGEIEAPDFYDKFELYTRCKWIGAGRGWIDPVKEAQAAQVRISARISTLEMECAEQGYDWQDVLEQTALEQARQKQLGIWIDPAPPKPAGARSAGGGSSKGGAPQDRSGEDSQGENYGE